MNDATILRRYLAGYYGDSPLARLPDDALESFAWDARSTVATAGYGHAWQPVAASAIYRSEAGR